jgi:hypothetical protein
LGIRRSVKIAATCHLSSQSLAMGENAVDVELEAAEARLRKYASNLVAG